MHMNWLSNMFRKDPTMLREFSLKDTIPVMNPIAKKMSKVLQKNQARFKITEVQIGHKSQFTVYLGEYSDDLVHRVKSEFSQDEDLRTYNVVFRAGIKGVPGPKKSIYRLTKVDSLGVVAVEHV